MSLSIDQLNRMTLAEILLALQLPAKYLMGDADHEETTEVMDAAAREVAYLASEGAVN